MDVYVVLQNALKWLHERCMRLVLGRKPEHESVSLFRATWLQAAMKGRYLVCAVAVWIVSGVTGSPLVCCNVWMQIAL